MCILRAPVVSASSSTALRLLGAVLCLAACFAAPGGAAGQAGAEDNDLAGFVPPGVKEIVRQAQQGSTVEDAPRFQLPISPGRLLYRFGEGLPPAAERFLDSVDRNAELYWDHRNGTLRTCVPFEPLPLLDPTAGGQGAQGEPPPAVSLSDTYGLTIAVEAFIDRHAELLGVDSGRLGVPYIYPLLDHRVLVFPLSTPGGIPVRGGHVRVVVLEDGRVGLVKAFTARGIEDPEGNLLEQSAAEEVVRSEGWGEAHSARLEIVFPGDDVGSALPAWSLDVREPDGGSAELLLDARTGELLGRIVVVKHFDGEGGGAGPAVHGKVHTNGPRIEDKFQSPWLPADKPLNESVLEGILTGEVLSNAQGNTSQRVATLSDESGDFRFESKAGAPKTQAFASLRSGHLEECEDSPECRFTPVVQVVLPRLVITGQGLPEGVRPTALASNQVDLGDDQVIDVVEEAALNGPDLDLRFNAAERKDASSERAQAHWLQSYEAGRSITSFATRELQGFFGLSPQQVRKPPFLPVSPVCMMPLPIFEDLADRDHGAMEMAINAIQAYSPPGTDCTGPVDGRETRMARVFTGLLFSSNDRDPFALPWPGEQEIHVNSFEAVRLEAEGKPATKFVEEVLPTILQHEVGHHIFFHLTQTHASHDVRAEALEDGVADVLTAWENEDPRIGFRRTSQGFLVATSKSFSLEEHFGENFRDALRIEVGEGFWELRQELALRAQIAGPEIVRVAHYLLLGWLMLHRMEGPKQGQALDRSHDLITLLKWVDEFLLPGQETDRNIANGTPHSQVIDRAFRDGSYFQAVPFQRGDANLDQRLDVSDVIFSLRFLFGGDGATHDCRNAIDVNNDSVLNLTDPIGVLSFLFQGGPPPAEPWQFCGFDLEPPGEEGNLGCLSFTCRR